MFDIFGDFSKWWGVPKLLSKFEKSSNMPKNLAMKLIHTFFNLSYKPILIFGLFFGPRFWVPDPSLSTFFAWSYTMKYEENQVTS